MRYDKMTDEEIERLATERNISAGMPGGYDRQYAINQLRSGDTSRLVRISLGLALISIGLSIVALVF